jgi:hypothetical protein
MKKFVMFLAIGGMLVGAGMAMADAPAAPAAPVPCTRTKFETKTAEDACKKGGQEEAKKAFKAWLTEAKAKDATLTCKTCHANMAPKFDLNPDALKKFKDLGGK